MPMNCAICEVALPKQAKQMQSRLCRSLECTTKLIQRYPTQFVCSFVYRVFHMHPIPWQKIKPLVTDERLLEFAKLVHSLQQVLRFDTELLALQSKEYSLEFEFGRVKKPWKTAGVTIEQKIFNTNRHHKTFGAAFLSKEAHFEDSEYTTHSNLVLGLEDYRAIKEGKEVVVPEALKPPGRNVHLVKFPNFPDTAEHLELWRCQSKPIRDLRIVAYAHAAFRFHQIFGYEFTLKLDDELLPVNGMSTHKPTVHCVTFQNSTVQLCHEFKGTTVFDKVPMTANELEFKFRLGIVPGCWKYVLLGKTFTPELVC